MFHLNICEVIIHSSPQVLIGDWLYVSICYKGCCGPNVKNEKYKCICNSMVCLGYKMNCIDTCLSCMLSWCYFLFIVYEWIRWDKR